MERATSRPAPQRRSQVAAGGRKRSSLGLSPVRSASNLTSRRRSRVRGDKLSWSPSTELFEREFLEALRLNHGSNTRVVAKEKPGAHLRESLTTQPDVRVHFGGCVMLQHNDTDSFVIVKNTTDESDDGLIIAGGLEAVKPADVCRLRLVDLADGSSCRAACFGDWVWFQIFPGTGEPTWKNGSVIGAKVHEADKLPTVALESDNTSPTQVFSTISTAKVVGRPIPVRATLPSVKGDPLMLSHSEIRSRNERALTLGRFRVMPATEDLASRAKKRGGYICNMDEVYLEQDFYYLCKDSDSPNLTLHKLTDNNFVGEHLVEKRGVWRFRVASSTQSLGELSRTELRSELLMEKARKSLKNSTDHRHKAALVSTSEPPQPAPKKRPEKKALPTETSSRRRLTEVKAKTRRTFKKQEDDLSFMSGLSDLSSAAPWSLADEDTLVMAQLRSGISQMEAIAALTESTLLTSRSTPTLKPPLPTVGSSSRAAPLVVDDDDLSRAALESLEKWESHWSGQLKSRKRQTKEQSLMEADAFLLRDIDHKKEEVRRYSMMPAKAQRKKTLLTVKSEKQVPIAEVCSLKESLRLLDGDKSLLREMLDGTVKLLIENVMPSLTTALLGGEPTLLLQTCVETVSFVLTLTERIAAGKTRGAALRLQDALGVDTAHVKVKLRAEVLLREMARLCDWVKSSSSSSRELPASSSSERSIMTPSSSLASISTLPQLPENFDEY